MRKEPDDLFERIEQFAREMKLHSSDLRLTVTEAQQQQELERLTRGRREEQFFGVFDLRQMKITTAAGWEEMGYADQMLTFRDYLNMIPSKAVSELILVLGKQAYQLAAKLGIVRFMRPKYISQVPLRHRDGRLLLCKRTISAWQISSTGLIVSYLSEFTILKEFENEPLNPRFLGLNEAVRLAFTNLVEQAISKSPKATYPFAPREQQILKLYAEHTETALSAGDIAERLGMKTSTVLDYNKQIMQKARQYFGNELPAQTARDVAIFLQKNGLLGSN